jgi:16S rRNA (adenine1518-N6/adenine1519-N6)-dimethyltransferase
MTDSDQSSNSSQPSSQKSAKSSKSGDRAAKRSAGSSRSDNPKAKSKSQAKQKTKSYRPAFASKFGSAKQPKPANPEKPKLRGSETPDSPEPATPDSPRSPKQRDSSPKPLTPEQFERRFNAGNRAAENKAKKAQKSGHQPRKRFGQHWLTSDRVLNEIIAAARLTSSDRILEIGPGKGILTHRLLERAESVVAVELDRDLCDPLVAKFGERDNFLLLQGDFLALEVDALTANFADRFHGQTKVVANIPYNITGPILEKLLGTIAQPNLTPFQEIVLLVQKEVADRLSAVAGTKSFGALSVRVQYLADCELVCHVPATAFKPPPKVESAVIRLIPRPIVTPANDPKHLASIVKVGFANKRKMLRNNLGNIIDRDRLMATFEQLAINPEARAEQLDTPLWIALSNALCGAGYPSIDPDLRDENSSEIQAN